MFDTIGVSERTQKPWTVVVSFIGQMAVIGLAILAPLVGTDALPHPLSWISLPEPPRALPRRPAAAVAANHNKMIPSQFTPKGLVLPRRIPDKPMILQDPDSLPAASVGVGVDGGFGNSTGSGDSVIDSLVRSASVAAPPPPPVMRREAPKPVPRITVGGNVQKGKLISGPRPIYPPLARQARVSGTVKLKAVISRDGTILDLRAVSGHPLLIPAALAAVAHWVFSPTCLNGDPVEVATDIEVTFTLAVSQLRGPMPSVRPASACTAVPPQTATPVFINAFRKLESRAYRTCSVSGCLPGKRKLAGSSLAIFTRTELGCGLPPRSRLLARLMGVCMTPPLRPSI